ncbi:MAG: carbohydrate ABC transporter permease [Ignavibacteria bacterium]|nr:carbohydrate ABC transporter permease [Ignavibacteria bacterium]MBL7992787.1 carbohydrate ABC transporter permease [Candidatus Kapabacteria bacterium]
MNSSSIRSLLAHSLRYAVLIAAAALMVFPLGWMLLLSLKERPQSYATFIDLLFAPNTLANYRDILLADTFGRYFLNSLGISVIVTLGNLLFCLMAAFAFARKEFRGRELFFTTVLGVMMIPPHVVMIPLYRMMVAFGWINTYYALIIPWLVMPFGIFLLRQYILSLPRDVEDAARIDGASEWYVLFRIVLPLAKPALTVLALYVFLATWNSFLFPFLFANDTAHRTLTVGLASFQGKQTIDWSHLMAGASISALPILILFLIFQKQIIQGLTAGALKE